MGQANADFPTEVKKEREEETKFFTENIDVENVTIIPAQIDVNYINGKTMATTTSSNATENIVENNITAKNEKENTLIYCVDCHNEQKKSEYPTEVEEERKEATKCSTKFIYISKIADVEKTLLDQNDVEKF